MAAPPALFDPNLKDLRRARAGAVGFADFLHIEAREIVLERLSEVNRSFTDPLIVSPWPSLWSHWPGARIIPDHDTLEVAQGIHDLAIHGLCLHGANDPVGQLVQLRHALKPDGLMVAALFGGQTLHELRACIGQAESEIRGGLSPRVSPMGDIRDLGALLQRAGFALPVADSVRLTATYETPLHLMRELRAMGETNMMADQARGFLRRDVLARTLELYRESFSTDDGRVAATFEVVFLTGWAPAHDQQKPLKPGSAAARLADALNTQERSAGEKPGGN